MTEHYDDMMKDRLNGHESPVPKDMFSHIQARLDAMDQSFDATVNDAVSNYASPVPAHLFTEISNELQAGEAAFDVSMAGKVNNYSSEVPADMWARIMKEKDKRRPIAWWWAAALLFLLAGGGGIYNYVTTKKTGHPANATGVGTNSGTGLQNGDAVKAKKEATNSSNDVDESIGDLPVPDSGIGSSDVGKQDLTSKAEVNKNSSKAYKNDVGTAGNSGNQNIFLSNKKNTGKNTGKNNRRNNKKETYSQFYKQIDAAIDDEAHQTEPAGITINDAEMATTADKQLALRLMIRSAFNKLAPLQLLQAKSPILPCPITGDEPRKDWYLDAYISPLLVFKNVTDKTAGKNVGPGMDSTLHKQLSFNAGINLVKNIGENFLLKTGLQYNLVNELFKQTRVNEIKLITTVTVRTVILSPGDTIYIRDTSVVQQIGTVTKQTQNNYKSWDVPLILGYEFGGKDLRLNANLGIIANIKTRYKGDILLDTTRQAVNIADYKGTGVYKTNVGLGIYAGLAIVKAIGERTDIMIEPHARYNLINTTTDAAWFKQQNIVAGVSMGIRYKLNGKRQR